MHAVYKYALTSGRFHASESIQLPEDAEFLDVQWQGNALTLWFLVDPSNPPVERYFFLAATGVKYPALDEGDAEYLGTVQVPSSGMVVHLFEIPEAT